MPSSFKLGGYTLKVLGSSKLLRTGRIASFGDLNEFIYRN